VCACVVYFVGGFKYSPRKIIFHGQKEKKGNEKENLKKNTDRVHVFGLNLFEMMSKYFLKK